MRRGGGEEGATEKGADPDFSSIRILVTPSPYHCHHSIIITIIHWIQLLQSPALLVVIHDPFSTAL
jgi:hypothetical protein